MEMNQIIYLCVQNILKVAQDTRRCTGNQQNYDCNDSFMKKNDCSLIAERLLVKEFYLYR